MLTISTPNGDSATIIGSFPEITILAHTPVQKSISSWSSDVNILEPTSDPESVQVHSHAVAKRYGSNRDPRQNSTSSSSRIASSSGSTLSTHIPSIHKLHSADCFDGDSQVHR